MKKKYLRVESHLLGTIIRNAINEYMISKNTDVENYEAFVEWSRKQAQKEIEK